MHRRRREPHLTAPVLTTASAPPQPVPPAPDAAPRAEPLQRTLGNQVVQDLMRAAGSAPDVLEQQATAVAEAATGSTQATPQSLAANPAKQAGPVPAIEPPGGEVDEALSTGGNPLESTTRRRLEDVLGTPLANVRVHMSPEAGISARHHDALAYATGSHIVFGQGQYRPGTSEGDRLLAHEVAHVVQQRAIPGAPTLQRQPAPQSPNLDQVLTDLAHWATRQGGQADPAEIRGALQQLTTFGVPLANIQFLRLANAQWVIGGLHIGAESRWPTGGSPEIAPSDDLLRSFHLYQSNRTQHRDVGFSIIRTLGHELRHLQRQHQRDTGARGPTTAERRFEAEITRLAAATPARLTPQEYAEVYTGRVLHAQVAYPVEEVFARLAELEFVRLEWTALQAKTTGATQADREHIEDILWEIGFRLAYQVTMLRNTASQTTAGFTPKDFQASMREIETEINNRYGRNSPERRLWDLVVAQQFHQSYAPQILSLGSGGSPGQTQLGYQTLVVVLPRVFP